MHLLIPRKLQKDIRPPESKISIKYESSCQVSLERINSLSVNVVSRSKIVKYNVVYSLETELIHDCASCESHVKSIRPKKRLIELAGETTIPILTWPQKRSENIDPKQGDQAYIVPKSGSIHEVCVNKAYILQPGSENWMPDSMPQAGLLQIKPYKKLHETRHFSVSHEAAWVEPGIAVDIVITNSGDKPLTLRINHLVETADPHASEISESTITLAEIFLSKEKNVKTIGNETSADVTQCPSTNVLETFATVVLMQKRPTTEDNIDLCNVDKIFHQRIRDMLKRRKNRSNGRLALYTLLNMQYTSKTERSRLNHRHKDLDQQAKNSKHSNSKNRSSSGCSNQQRQNGPLLAFSTLMKVIKNAFASTTASRNRWHRKTATLFRPWTTAVTLSAKPKCSQR